MTIFSRFERGGIKGGAPRGVIRLKNRVTEATGGLAGSFAGGLE